MNAFSKNEQPTIKEQIIIRPLTADDYVQYRALRQRILQIGDGQYFSDSYERENQLTNTQQWRDWCTEKREHCIIGTFAGEELIGVMAVTMQWSEFSNVVEWEATWLDPAYRHLGLAKLAYDKVHEWTKNNGYEYAVVFIRDTNMRSRAIREKQGFIYRHSEDAEVWADGSIGAAHFFTLDLYPSCSQVSPPELSPLDLIYMSLRKEKHPTEPVTREFVASNVLREKRDRY